MIKTFRNKDLADLWSTGRSKIDVRMHKRILVRLAVINDARAIADIDVSGYNFHALRGFSPTRYTIHANGPWCITFEFKEENAYRVDFEQYH